ncbi:ABC transporter substrate-binding protein [Calothrix sp. FACHB-156]|nr:ABC transporter substrate-binding protein [Calothrix sp. FACHB-156]
MHRINPYIVGRPINEPDKFFGRETLFTVIEDSLRQNVQLILLYGQRRIGKSSVLKQIPHKIAEEKFVFIHFDIQDQAACPLYEILHRIAQAIIEHLELDGKIEVPQAAAIQKNHEIFSREFLSNIYNVLADRNLVLLLDEFDVLSETNNNLDNQLFFNYIRSLLKQYEKKLFIIPVVGRHLNELQTLRNFLKESPYQEIAFLEPESAEQMITKPAVGTLTYEAEAIQKILKLSAGHPYFTQVICFTLFVQARDMQRWHITARDVEGIENRVFQDGTAQAGLAWFWDGLPILERLVMLGVVEAQKIALEKNKNVTEEPLTVLRKYGIVVTTSLQEAAKQLTKNGFLDNTGSKIKIELVRLWLMREYSLKQEIDQWKNMSKQENENNTKLLIIGSIAAFTATAIISAIGFGGYRLLTPCPAGEQKNLGIRCIADTNPISRGERTLYPKNINKNRDKGILEFKNGNYKYAKELLRQAVDTNHNDPEVLIYYNNARAREQGSPVSLAVAVPVNQTESNDLEILRGVAQAQNQFNDQRGSTAQLLEIVIANDGNDKTKAQQVAQKLGEDKSIMGVIGHNSSDSTKEALKEYRKARLPVISSTSTSTSLLHGNTFFRTVPSDAMAGKQLAEYAWNTLKVKKALIFYKEDSNYSRSIKDEFKKTFEKLSTQEPLQFDLSQIDANFDLKSQLPSDLLVEQAIAIILLPSSETDDTTKAINVAQKAKNIFLNPNPKKSGLNLLGGDAFYSYTTIKKGGDAVEGLVLSVPWFRHSPQSGKFANQAKQQWNGEVSWRTATSYDATQAFIKTLFPHPSRQTILQRLKEVNVASTETSGEPIQFKQGERQNQPVLVKVEGGDFVKIE